MMRRHYFRIGPRNSLFDLCFDRKQTRTIESSYPKSGLRSVLEDLTNAVGCFANSYLLTYNYVQIFDGNGQRVGAMLDQFGIYL